jgi:flagellar basal body-associated protein FliL
MEAPETKTENKEPAKKKKSGRTAVFSVVMTVVALGAAAAGAMLGPKVLAAAGPSASHAAPSASSEEAEEMEGESVQFESIVVDVHDDAGATHHLKLGLAAELPKKVERKEFERYSPRGRQAAIAYLRALSFKEATSADKFIHVRDEVCEKVARAIGSSRVKRVLVTDYVTQ